MRHPEISFFLLGRLIWDINFKCFEATSYAQIESESACHITTDYFTREACQVFVSSSWSTITITIVSIFVILIATLVGLYYYIRRVRRKYNNLNQEDKNAVRVYLKVMNVN